MAERYFGADKPSDAAPEPSGATKVEEADGADSVIVVTPEQVRKASELSSPFRVPPFFASRSSARPEADETVQAAGAEQPALVEPPANVEPPGGSRQPAEPEQPVEPENADDVDEPASDEPVPAEADLAETAVAEPAAAEPATASSALSMLPGGDDRWHEMLSSFVDDPRGAVDAASAIVEEEIAAFAAMLASLHAGQDASTEDLRVALRAYRDFGRMLVTIASSLS